MQVHSVVKALSLFIALVHFSSVFPMFIDGRSNLNASAINRDAVNNHTMLHRNAEICNQLQERYDDFQEGKEFLYECCDRVFSQRDALRSHVMLSHSICFDCVMLFNSIDQLISHIVSKTTHGNKLCEYCKRFSAKTMHELNAHKPNCHFRPGIHQLPLRHDYNVANVVNIQNAPNVVNVQIKQEFYTSVYQQNFQDHRAHPLQSPVTDYNSCSADCLEELFNTQDQIFDDELFNDQLEQRYLDYKYICGTCAISFSEITDLEVHCLGDHLRCPWCLDFAAQGSFNGENKRLFALHVASAHPDKNIHYCEKCDIFTDDVTQIARHVVSCGNNTSRLVKPYACPPVNIQPRPNK